MNSLTKVALTLLACSSCVAISVWLANKATMSQPKKLQINVIDIKEYKLRKLNSEGLKKVANK